MQRGPHWPKLLPIFKEGIEAGRNDQWRNTYPARSLRWYAYEAGWDIGIDETKP
jgi:hypothetical protein